MSILDMIAAGQQRVVVNRQQGTAFAPIPSNSLDMGKYSDLSQPVDAPWNKMPDGGFPFSSNGTIDLPTITGGPPYTWSDVIGPNGQYQMQVPNGNDGVIKRIVCSYNGQGFNNGSGQLFWRILLNGQAVRNYDLIPIQLGLDGVTGYTEGIRIYSNQTVQFQVTNVSLASGGTQIFCFLGGWYYPTKRS